MLNRKSLFVLFLCCSVAVTISIFFAWLYSNVMIWSITISLIVIILFAITLLVINTLFGAIFNNLSSISQTNTDNLNAEQNKKGDIYESIRKIESVQLTSMHNFKDLEVKFNLLLNAQSEQKKLFTESITVLSEKFSELRGSFNSLPNILVRELETATQDKNLIVEEIQQLKSHNNNQQTELINFIKSSNEQYHDQYQAYSDTTYAHFNEMRSILDSGNATIDDLKIIQIQSNNLLGQIHEFNSNIETKISGIGREFDKFAVSSGSQSAELSASNGKILNLLVLIETLEKNIHSNLDVLKFRVENNIDSTLNSLNKLIYQSEIDRIKSFASFHESLKKLESIDSLQNMLDVSFKSNVGTISNDILMSIGRSLELYSNNLSLNISLQGKQLFDEFVGVKNAINSVNEHQQLLEGLNSSILTHTAEIPYLKTQTNNLGVEIKTLGTKNDILLETQKANTADIQRYSKDVFNSLLRRIAVNTNQVEAFFGIYSMINPAYPLPQMRGWAISPDIGLRLMGMLLTHKPKVVLNVGCGLSDILMAYVVKNFKLDTVIISIESDSKFLETTKNNLISHSVDKYVTLLHAPLKTYDINGGSWLWYDIDVLPPVMIDILFVDGPPAATQKMARYPALPLLKHKLTDDCIIILDDAVRQEEKDIAKMWLNEMPSYSSEYFEDEKGTIIIKNK